MCRKPWKLFPFDAGAQLLQDHQAAHGPEEGEEEAAAAKLPLLPVNTGVCVGHAPDL